MTTRREWNPNERAVLKRTIERGDSIASISAVLKRTPNAIRTMATRLGLRRPAPVAQPLSVRGHHMQVVFEPEDVERMPPSGKRGPYIRASVRLKLAFDEAGIKGTPAELVARLLEVAHRPMELPDFVRGSALMTADYQVGIGTPEDGALMEAWESRNERDGSYLVTVPDFTGRVVSVTSDFKASKRLYRLQEAPHG